MICELFPENEARKKIWFAVIAFKATLDLKAGA